MTIQEKFQEYFDSKRQEIGTTDIFVIVQGEDEFYYPQILKRD